MGLASFCMSVLPVGLAAQVRSPLWADQTVTHVGREEATTLAIPIGSISDVGDLSPEDSPYFLSLNGMWKFHWCGDPDGRPIEFFSPSYDVSSWDDIKVPSNWQIEAVRRNKPWDKPLYCNTVYPFAPPGEVLWPNVIQPRPADFTYASLPNPVGSYRRTFTVPADWKGRDVFIRFNGVEAGYFLWVNGKEVGYSQDSYLPSEFNLTPYLVPGENVLAVEVYRWTDGSYLECQDFWRLSGIFRDVFLWSAPRTRIRDFVFETDLDERYMDASVTLGVEIAGRKPSRSHKIHCTLYDPSGKVVSEESVPAKAGHNSLTFTVRDPLKWTGETPNLYVLALVLEEGGVPTDIRSSKVGFRKIELSPDGQFLVNGKSVIFKGVNRHDHSSLNGRTVSREETEEDLRLMKSFNINAVRTSHYPDNPFFYDLCDEYGIYVLSEANVECHGLWNLSHEMTWAEAFSERCANMVRRYRNHPSIVIWSLGNEAGNGACHQASVAAIKDLDTSRPTHYCEDDRICDMTSKMYTKVGDLAGVGESRLSLSKAGQRVRPHLLCEYAHAMGNAIGNLREYVDTFEVYPALIGGFIWDWVDQGIQMPRPDGKGTYMAVGGDFGDIPNQGNFCANGVVFADRTYAPKALEVKKVYQPIAVKAIGEGRYEIMNKRFHTDLSDLRARVDVLIDGSVQRSIPIDVNPLPGESQVIALPEILHEDPGADYDLRFSFTTKASTPWMAAGGEIAAEQITLYEGKKEQYIPPKGELSLREAPSSYLIEGKGFAITFSKEAGALSSIIVDGTDMLCSPLEFNAYHAPLDNDRGKGLLAGMVRWGLFDLVPERGTWEVDFLPERAVLSIGNTYRGKEGFAYTVNTAYTVYPDGAILVRSDIIPSIEGVSVPRIGFKVRLPGDFSRFRYRGRGPFENYVDRCEAAFPGVYDRDVSEEWIDNIRPQQMGLRTAVEWMAITALDGKGLLVLPSVPMSFSALDADESDMFDHTDPSALRHAYTIPRLDGTVLCLDYAHRGIGNASCGPAPLPRYDLLTEPVSFDFLILPLRRDYTMSELIRRARIYPPSR